MDAGTSALGQVGAVCFGIAVGYLTCRMLARNTERVVISDVTAVAGVIGGAAVTGLFVPGTSVFAWYSIGLLAAMALFFVIFGRLNGWQHLATVMNARTGVLTSSTSGQPRAKQRPAAPDAAE
jgi:hypothetical protein